MPQYASTTYPHDDYWKLRDYVDLNKQEMKDLLTSRGKNVHGQVTSKMLRAELRRIDLGHMSYSPFSNEELRTFIDNRSIDASAVITKRRKGQRSELIELLTKADHERRFDKFEELPTEVRLRVYMHHLRGFKQDTLYAPTQPPISRVSKSTQNRGPA